MRTKHEIVSDTAKWINETDDEIRPLLIVALCGAASWLAWLCLPKGVGPVGVAYAFGLFVGVMYSVWLIIYARRSWITSRAIFELLAAESIGRASSEGTSDIQAAIDARNTKGIPP